MTRLLSFLIAATLTHHSIAQSLGDLHIQYEKVTSIHTDFIVPVSRFTILSQPESDGSRGRLLLFQSLGAGITIQRGHLRRVYDQSDAGKMISQQLQRRLGLQIGLLFGTRQLDQEVKTQFAPTVGVVLLDFHIGYGYELGAKSESETSHFVTVSYGIPLQRLSDAKGLLVPSSRGSTRKSGTPLMTVY